MSTSAGKAAEDRAAEYLKSQKYKLLDHNWRTRYCEIDLIAERKKVIWFVEVKYRRSSAQGFGYEYVTPKKLQQMQFAAEMWVHEHDWSGEYRLAVVSVDGETIQLLDNL